MFSFKNTFANIIPNIEDAENNNIVFIVPILFRLWRKKNNEAPNPNEPANTKYGIWKIVIVAFKSWIPIIIINKIKSNEPPINIFETIIFGIWIMNSFRKNFAYVVIKCPEKCRAYNKNISYI